MDIENSVLSPPLTGITALYSARPILILAFLAILASCSDSKFNQMVGMRFTQFEIEVDGQILYSGNNGVSLDMSAEEVWDNLGDVKFVQITEEPSTSNSPATAIRAITGEIVLRFGHGDFADERKVDTLELRSGDGGAWWGISPPEVQRIKRSVPL